jgi:transcriptional regulator with XRE-family HTH domain
LILTNELKGIYVAKGFNQEQIAKAIGITPKTFASKMKKGIFGSDEIDKLIEVLNISDPTPIFFAKK